MRLATLLALVAVLAAAPVAQPGPPGGGITGRVLDADAGTPLPLATVAVYQLPDTTFVTGTVADSSGTFTLTPLRPGEVQVRVSVVGYTTQRLDAAITIGPPVDLGEIRLEESAELLDAVSVEAERELIEQRADRTIYNVGDQPVTSGDNILETLKTLPSVEVDQDDNISLRGGRNVAIHVNGRPVPVGGQFLAAYLKQIGSDAVERVEVIPNPSARYEPDGLSGIINIVLKEDAPDRGLSGGLTLGGGTRPEANAGLNLAYQRGKFDVYGSYGYFYNRFDFDGSTEREYIVASSDLVTLDNIQTGDRLFDSHFANATVDYTLAERTTLSLSGNVSVRGGGGENLQAISSVFRDDGRTTLAERFTDSDSDGTNATATLSFQRRFDEDGRHELRAEARVSGDANTEDQVFEGALDGTSAMSSYLDESSRSENWLQLDYTHPIGDIRLETGAKATWETIANDVRFGAGGTDGLAEIARDGFDYDRSIYAAYLQAAVPFGSKFEAQAGLRAEVADRGFVIDSEGAANDFSYESLFPSAFVIYKLGPGTSVKGSYSRRINRPGTWFLSPFSSPEDVTTSRRGNPNLRPEYTDSYELALQYKFAVTLTPFYRRTTDVIAQRFLVEDGRTFFTSSNFATEQSYGADLTLAAAIPKTPIRGFVSGSVFRSETDGGAVDPTIDFGVTSWSARASMQAQVMANTSLQFFGFFRGPRSIANGRSSGFGFTSLGLSQKFLDNALSLSLRVNDPFSTTRFEFESENEAYTELGVRDPAQRSFSATLTWTFGKPAERRGRPDQQAPQGGDMGGGIGL